MANPPINIADIPPQIITDISWIVKVVEAAGILLVLYVIYLIVNGIFNFKNHKRIKEMNERIDKIENKINFLVLKEKDKELIEEKDKHKKKRK